MQNVGQGTRNNLHLTNDPLYKDLHVNASRGPLVVEYLEATERLLELVRAHHARSFVVNVTLTYPNELWGPTVPFKQHHTKFIKSLKAKIHVHEANLVANGVYDKAKLKFIRCTEVGNSGLHHHFILFFNASVFNHLGSYGSGKINLIHRINSAWASALEIPEPAAMDLVYFGNKHRINNRASDIEYDSDYRNLFHHCSYFTKHDTKFYGLGLKPFSTSRK